jgi:lipid-A-disaccharide synthase
VATVHYVSPSIWAWRGERIERIRRAADRILLVFPFEQEIYDRAGIPATYVGHPLASAIRLQPDRAAARARLGLGGDPLVCLMPGSRRAEIEFIGPVFLDAAALILRSLPGARFVLPVADASLRGRLLQLAAEREAIADRIGLVDGRSHDCLEACDGVLVASGTATLEAALFKRPMVIAYRMPWLSAWIHRRIGGYLPWVGLPNILARESLVPELLQEQATAPALARQLLRVLDDAPGQARLAARLQAMHESLRRDTAALAVEAILQTIAARAGHGAGRRP